MLISLRNPKHLVAIFCLGLACGLAPVSARGEIELIGTARLPGDGTDRSNLEDVLEGGVPHNRLGGISGIEYSGKGNRYLLLPDRGPLDGGTVYRCRFHVLDLAVQPGSSPAVAVQLVSTTMLQDEKGRNFVGSSSAFDEREPANGLRFDPEGIRLDRSGKMFLSDEYGPFVYSFDESGKRTAVLKVPARFQVSHPSAKPEEENAKNSTGRQPNGGLEGLAITPDGKKLYASMQRPLIQDSRPGDLGKRLGTNTRIIEFDVQSGGTREFLYPLESTANGVSEILAVNAHEFLVLERDGLGGTDAVTKKVFRIDIEGATDLSNRNTLPAEGVPDGVKPVRKALFLDMLSPKFGLAGAEAPEKIEGLTFGPDLPDGRRLLIVAVDNDFQAERPILLQAYAVDRADLPGFGW